MSIKQSSLIGLVLLSTTAGTVFAANEAQIIHRQGIYSIAGGHMKVLKSILVKDHPATHDVKYHAQSMLDAFQRHGNAFPEGSHKGKTRAKIDIWKKPEGFKEAGKNMGKALTALVEVSEFEDLGDMRAAFKDVGKACKGCHDDYRKEKKK